MKIKLSFFTIALHSFFTISLHSFFTNTLHKAVMSFVAVLLLTLTFSSGSVFAQSCDRACLEGHVDSYFDAVINNDPARLPLADDIRFTENGQLLRIGDGLWNSMKGTGTYRLFVTDVDAGQVTFLGTITEDHRDPALATPVVIALRLRVEDGEIDQIEQLVVRDTAMADRINLMEMPHELYSQTVPEDERMSRENLANISNMYFSGMQMNDGLGDYPFAADCLRIENGMQSTSVPTPAGETRPDPLTSSNYSGQWSCLEQFESGLLHFVNRIRDRRYVAIDQERGIVFSFAFFDHSGGETRNFETPDGRSVTAGPVQPWTWEIAEIFKIENGEIRRIEAIMTRSAYGMNSGWSNWEDGMSDRLQDVTFD